MLRHHMTQKLSSVWKRPNTISQKIQLPIFLLFILHQSLLTTIQIKKSLQKKFFHFFIQNILTFSPHQSIFAIEKCKKSPKAFTKQSP
jgi:hypothetical protein